MIIPPTESRLAVNLGWAQRNRPGSETGSARGLVLADGGAMLALLVDGLGHGPEAAEAACAVTQAHAQAAPAEIVRLCDQALVSTRGAALAVLKADPEAGVLTWSAVGGSLFVRCLGRHTMVLPISPGLVGMGLRRIEQSSHLLTPGQVLMIGGPGLGGQFRLEDYAGLPAQDMAERLVAEFGRKDDDAVCLVMRA